jgi:preprotein translocase subunit SecA
MSELSVSRPGIRLPATHAFPERRDARPGWQRTFSAAVAGLTQRALLPWRERRADAFVAAVKRHGDALAELDRDALVLELGELRSRLRREGLADDTVARAFALVRRTATGTIGLSHYEVQLKAAYAILHGRVAELETGEGKTLTATLAAATAALAGTHVHVITVNDYLAARDREAMAPLYEALGLSVGLVVGGMAPEQRQAAYQTDITYCTNKEAAFDYLRDRMTLENNSSSLRIKLGRLLHAGGGQVGPLMRGLQFAIVDEADSVLIDEARTPLIISERTDPELERQRAERALGLAAQLEAGHHYSFRGEHRKINLTTEGEQTLMRLAQDLPGSWRSKLYREEQVRNALAALHVFHRDQHYLVRDDRIEIIDENTGRVMPDRSWGEGIHQMIEVKEHCTVTGQTVPLAQMTYQRFFRRYRKLAGMTGTAAEARGELWSVYRLPVTRIPTHRPLLRDYRRPRIFATADDKWQHIVHRTRELSDAGVPVLIGTRSVASSEAASASLAAAGIAHRVLNAAQDQHEADIIANAGQTGRVTVATNMAGRGVDIRVDPAALPRGGLHVIMSERHDSGRIDRQLFGRCARQGEPGTVEVYLSLEDALLTDAGLSPPGSEHAGHRQQRIFERAQDIMERRHRKVRRDLMRWEEQSGTVLAFSGTME